jgi:ribosome biogenesis GTPase A
MKIENVPESELSSYLLEVLVNKYPKNLKERYSLSDEELSNEELIFKGIARRRGLLLPGNELDVNKAELLLLKEFKEGLIVKLVLDQLC